MFRLAMAAAALWVLDDAFWHLRHRNPHLALTGWVIAIPLGYLLDRFLVSLVKNVTSVQIPLTFPLWYLAPALAGTILLALLITLLPIRRAVRYRPGDAMRYA